MITEEIQTIKYLVNEINLTKDDLASIVREDRDDYQRHQFIHDAYSGIMTEQVYRHIHYFDKEVTNVWFNWASRPVPKTYSNSDAIKMLNDQLSRPKYLMSPKEWENMINKTINDVASGKFDYIQQMKEFRVLPTVELQFFEMLDVKKRRKSNATTPIILLGQEKNVLPKFSALKPYVNKNKDKTMTLSSNKTMLNNYLRLVGVKNI